jgi:uncharacterized protein (TIRG00374 family)
MSARPRVTAPDPGSPRPRSYLRHAFTAAVSALALWFLWKVLADIGLVHLWARLRKADGLLVALAIGLTVLRFLLLALRWEVLARREAPVGLRQITPVLMAGNFLALVTPALRVAGPILRAYYLSKETGRPRARFYGTIVADQTSNFSVYAVAASLAGLMVSLPERFRISPAVGGAMLGALVVGLTIGHWMLREVHAGKPSKVVVAFSRVLGQGREGGWRQRFIAWWDHLMVALSASVIGSGAWWPSLGLSALIFMLVVAVQMLAFAAVGTHMGAIDASFAVAGAGFLQILAAAPGGPGITEASLIGVCLALGMDGESAAAGVLVARFVNYVVLLPWGGHAFLVLQRRYGVPRSGAEGVAA